MSHTDILKAIFTKVSSIVGLPQIIFPNVGSSPIGEYIQVFIIPAQTVQETYTTGLYKFGIIQINIVTADKIGEIKASTYADIILTALKNSTVISGGLKVAKPPYASTGMNDGLGHYVLPVTIPYKILDN